MATCTWLGTTSIYWNTATNWSSSTKPTTGDTVEFTSSSTNLATVKDISALSLAAIVISSDPGGNVSIDNSTGTLTLTGSPGITCAYRNLTISGSKAIILGAAQTWTSASGKTLTHSALKITNGGYLLTLDGSGDFVMGDIAGTGGVTKTGSGNVTCNSGFGGRWSGTNTISGGIWKMTIEYAAGSSTSNVIVNSGGTLDLNGQIFGDETRTLDLSGAGVSSNGALINSAGTYDGAQFHIKLSGNATIGGATGGNINIVDINDNAGSYSITKVGSNILFLDIWNGSTYDGGTIISGGTIHTTTDKGSGYSALGTGTVTVNSGGTLNGTGEFTGALTVNSGGTVQVNDATTKGIMYAMGTADLSSGGAINIRVAAYATAGTNFDRLAVTSTLTLGGTSVLNLDLTGCSTTGTATGIITCSNTPSAFTTVNVTNNTNNYTVTVAYGAGTVNVTIAAASSSNWLKKGYWWNRTTNSSGVL